MLKTAYHVGVEQALLEENIEALVKEAQELGLDLEKLGFGGILGQLGQYAGRAAGFLGKHPMAGRMLGGAALGGTAAGLTGGNVLQGMGLGAGGGLAFHGLGGTRGIGQMLNRAPTGAFGKFTQGFGRGYL